MTTMTGTKKSIKRPEKYHYFFHYTRGNYFQISNGLKKRYPKSFYGSGTFLTENRFDIHFYCTARQYKNIVACARRRYGRIANVDRYTNEEYNAD